MLKKALSTAKNLFSYFFVVLYIRIAVIIHNITICFIVVKVINYRHICKCMRINFDNLEQACKSIYTNRMSS